MILIFLHMYLVYRWNRLENLLVQGRQDRDFTTKEALQPVLKLLLDPEGEELRVLVVKEAVYVTEAVVLGTMINSYNSIPEFMRTLISNGNPIGPFKLNHDEQERMLELRDRVFRIWSLLRSSENFDPSLLQPILQVLFFISSFSPFAIVLIATDLCITFTYCLEILFMVFLMCASIVLFSTKVRLS